MRLAVPAVRALPPPVVAAARVSSSEQSQVVLWASTIVVVAEVPHLAAVRTQLEALHPDEVAVASLSTEQFLGGGVAKPQWASTAVLVAGPPLVALQLPPDPDPKPGTLAPHSLLLSLHLSPLLKVAENEMVVSLVSRGEPTERTTEVA